MPITHPVIPIKILNIYRKYNIFLSLQKKKNGERKKKQKKQHSYLVPMNPQENQLLP